jgi:hypothetical protein
VRNGGVISIAACSAALAPADPFAGACSALLETRGVMQRLKSPTEKLLSNVALLAWALVLAFILSLMLFGVMFAAAYVVDEFYSPSLNDASYPPARPDGR